MNAVVSEAPPGAPPAPSSGTPAGAPVHGAPVHGAKVAAPLVLRSVEFRRAREPSWRELEGLVARMEKRGIATLGPEELERLPLLYRGALSSLAVARSIALDRNLLLYLENLSMRAFLAVYAPRSSALDGIRDFFARGFPAGVRAMRWHLALALAAFLAGGILGYMLTIADEAWYANLVPESLAGSRGPRSTRDELLRGEIFAPYPGFAASFIVFANALFQHNAVIGILSFGLGAVAGIPTLLLIGYQGLILGAMLALHANRDLAVEFLGWVSIHGVTEIGAILLCGAAGLAIAEKILVPGTYSRLDNLALSGRAAAVVASGAVLMFLIAGLIEGGLRQLIQPTGVRFAIAGVTLVLWIAYFTFAGRRASR